MQKIMERQSLRVNGPAVVFPMREWKRVAEDLEEYREKQRLSDGIKNFESLSKWGRLFAKKQKITAEQILEDD